MRFVTKPLLVVSLLLAPVATLGALEQVHTVAVKLQTPKSDRDKRAQPPYDEVQFDLWLPGDVPVLRGVVVNPYHRPAATQRHWQEACRHWGFALVGCDFFGVKESDFRTLFTALERFAAQTQHPELAHVPLCYVGMSAGAGMSMRFTALAPQRTLAAAPVCLEVGPRTPESRSVPIVTIFGEKDGRQMEQLLAKLPAERQEHARWAIAVQWGRRHEFARANNLAMPWFDRVIAHRLPDNVPPGQGVSLRDCPESSGWLGSTADWSTIAPYEEFSGDRTQACWLPDAYVAHVWQAFVARSPQVRIEEPAGLGDGAPLVVHESGEPIRVRIKLTDPSSVQRIELYRGDTRWLAAAGAATDLQGPPLPPGIHALFAAAVRNDGTRHLSPPNTILVRAGR
jgi:hypothetical protein